MKKLLTTMAFVFGMLLFAMAGYAESTRSVDTPEDSMNGLEADEILACPIVRRRLHDHRSRL